MKKSNMFFVIIVLILVLLSFFKPPKKDSYLACKPFYNIYGADIEEFNKMVDTDGIKKEEREDKTTYFIDIKDDSGIIRRETYFNKDILTGESFIFNNKEDAYSFICEEEKNLSMNFGKLPFYSETEKFHAIPIKDIKSKEDIKENVIYREYYTLYDKTAPEINKKAAENMEDNKEFSRIDVYIELITERENRIKITLKTILIS